MESRQSLHVIPSKKKEGVREALGCRGFPPSRQHDHNICKHILRSLREVSSSPSDHSPQPLRKDAFHAPYEVLFLSNLTPKSTWTIAEYKVLPQEKKRIICGRMYQNTKSSLGWVGWIKIQFSHSWTFMQGGYSLFRAKQYQRELQLNYSYISFSRVQQRYGCFAC